MSISATLKNQLAHNRRFMTAAQFAFLSSPEAAEAAAAAEDDPHASAVMMIETLKGLALDPLRGTKPEHFMVDHGDHTTFWLHFDRVAHFVPMFDLDKVDPSHTALVSAIRTNLASKMYKAAVMNRRCHNRLVRLETRNIQKWHKVHDAFMDEQLKPGIYGRARDDIMAQAAVKANAATQARDLQLRLRSRAISGMAAPSLVGKAWSEWVIDRLAASLPALVPATA